MPRLHWADAGVDSSLYTPTLVLFRPPQRSVQDSDTGGRQFQQSKFNMKLEYQPPCWLKVTNYLSVARAVRDSRVGQVGSDTPSRSGCVDSKPCGSHED